MNLGLHEMKRFCRHCCLYCPQFTHLGLLQWVVTMTISTNRIIQVNITSDPTSALAGTKMSIYNGMLEQAQTVQMNAGVTGTATVMQNGDTIDLDNNGTFESTYVTRFNFPTSTYTLANGTTIAGAVNFIKVTTAGVNHYYLIIPDFIAAQLDASNITSINPNGSLTASPNTAGDNFNDATTYILTCYAEETRILTARGERQIGKISVGDRIWVKDRGLVPAAWIGKRQAFGRGRFAPIHFEAGAIGNSRPLRVSPQHRMYVEGAQIELMFGTPAALVRARNLVGKPGVTVKPCNDITYVHLMFDRHGVISAEGALSESYFPGEYSLNGQDAQTRSELFQLFPELEGLRQAYQQTCLPCLNRTAAGCGAWQFCADRVRGGCDWQCATVAGIAPAQDVCCRSTGRAFLRHLRGFCCGHKIGGQAGRVGRRMRRHRMYPPDV